MTIVNQQNEAMLRQSFKKLNFAMVGMWRLGLRRWINIWPSVGGQILAITHTGRKTGLRRRTPVNYVQEGNVVYFSAGFGHVSDWYRNILANPEVEIWMPDGWWAGLAEDISDDPERLPLLRRVIVASGIVGRLFGFDLQHMTDVELDQLTSSYRLVRVTLTERMSGSDGPGDLAWVWVPLGLVGLLIYHLLRRRK